MKIALIGNMNNNHFALMRYFRDLGHDAYLLLYSDDGTGANAHFVPENDTWIIEKWRKYIIQTSIPNGSLKGIVSIYKNCNSCKKYLDGYDLIIGNGFAPAICYILKFKLDLFLPYAFGIEFTRSYSDKNKHLQKLSELLHFWFQNKGLNHNVVKVGTIDLSFENIKNLYKLKIESKIEKISIPMIYIEDNNFKLNCSVSTVLTNCLNRIKTSKLSIFSHVSHVKYGLGSQLKRNDILINGIAEFTRKSKNFGVLLVLVDYGDNVQFSKNLISELGIENNVIWLPKLSRKELMLILPHVTVGGGELGGAYWGGTGWEFLASGVPFFQNTGMTKDEFEEKTGTPMPEIFNVKSPQEISDILMDIEKKKIDLKAISNNLKSWFHTYNGKSEAERIISIITNNH